MRIAFVTHRLSFAGGGISSVVEDLSREVEAQGLNVHALGLSDTAWKSMSRSWRGAPACGFHTIGPASLGYAPTLRRALLAGNYDVVHTHGLWMHTSADVVRWSAGKRPYVVSPHGMLDPWALQNSSYKKFIAGRLFENRHLREAACVHALTFAEAASIAKMQLGVPVAVIPNGVEIPPPRRLLQPPWHASIPEGAPILLFLSRLHPKKNIEGLLRAFAQVRRRRQLSDWHLVVAGWGEEGYVQHLQALTAELDLLTHVCFVGTLLGDAKSAAYQHASAFVLPSYSEGLPMAVLEAWAHSLPTAITDACNLQEGIKAGAAWRIRPDDLSEDLADFLMLSDTALAGMGSQGRKIAEGQFCWSKVAGEFADLYRWLAVGGPQPKSVLR